MKTRKAGTSLSVVAGASLTLAAIALAALPRESSKIAPDLSDPQRQVTDRSRYGDTLPTIIDTLIVCQNDTAYVVEKTRIAPGGHLKLIAAHLCFSGNGALKVEESGSFTTEQGSRIFSGDSGLRSITARRRSNICWRDSKFTGFHKLIVYGNDSTRITGNEFYGNRQGEQDEVTPIDEHLEGNGLTVLCCVGNFEVSGNTAHDNERAGFLFQHCYGVQITGNTAYDNRFGIRLRYSSGCSITGGNNAHHNSEFGLWDQSPNGNNIEGNIFNYNDEAGIKLCVKPLLLEYPESLPGAMRVIPIDRVTGNTVQHNGDGIVTYGVDFDSTSSFELVSQNERAGVVLIDTRDSNHELVSTIGEHPDANKAVQLYSVLVEARRDESIPESEFFYVTVTESDLGRRVCRELGGGPGQGKNDGRTYDHYHRHHTCWEESRTKMSDLQTSELHWYTTPESVRKRMPSIWPIIENLFTQMFLVRRYVWPDTGGCIDVCHIPGSRHCCRVAMEKWTNNGQNYREGEFCPLEYDGPVHIIVGTHADVLLVKTDSAGRIAITELEPLVAHKPAGATVVRGVLRVLESAIRHSTLVLLNSAGRKVMDLRPGPNDIRHISPGAYFVRQSNHQGTRLTKVVVTR